MFLRIIHALAHHFMFAGTLGFFGIGMGPSDQEKSQYGSLAGAANFGTSEGEGDVLASDNFWKSIMSGDPTAISRVLGPEMSAVNKQGQEAKKTASEFGNRGGGTNAGMQLTDDHSRSSIDSMISSLTGKAAGELGSSGRSLFGEGVSAHEGAFDEAHTMQQQHEAQISDLFKSITSVVASLPFPGTAGKVAKDTIGATNGNNYFDESGGTD